MEGKQFDLRTCIWKIIEYVYFVLYWFVIRFTNGRTDCIKCLIGKTAIVTGGNSGIGEATVGLLASRGCRVIIADKVLSEVTKDKIITKTGNSNIILKQLDLSSFDSIRKFAEDIKKTEEKIDILINNAGISASPTKCSTDGNNYVMQINYFGAFLLTHLLLEKLKASKDARIVFASSVLSFLNNVNSENLNLTKYEQNIGTNKTWYANSKLCNILAAQFFAEKLKKFNISVFSVDPGVSRSPIYNDYGRELPGGWLIKVLLELLLLLGHDAHIAAQSAFHVSMESKKELLNGGHYFRCKSFTKPWICYDKKTVDEIMKQTEEIVQLKPGEKI